MSAPQGSWRRPRVPHLSVELLCGACDDYGRDWAAHGRPVLTDDFTRLYVLDSGSAELWFNGEDRLLAVPGFLYLVPAGRSVRYRCPESMRLSWVHLRVQIVPMMDLFSRWNPPRSVPCDGEMRLCFARLLEGLGCHSPRAAFSRVGHAVDLLSPFLPQAWDEVLPSSDVQERLQPTLEALHRDMSRRWALADLAGLVHLHPTYFSNLFRETFGVSPMRYLAQLRIRRARELLTRTDYRISDISARCGFGDPLHFSRSFRKATGYSPRAYRARGGGVAP